MCQIAQVVLAGRHGLPFRGSQIDQRSSTDPTVNPAPTEASSTRLPFFSRPSATASASASGIVPAVVLPYFSMLMTTLSGGRPKPLGGRHDDAAIGLVRHEQIDVLRPVTLLRSRMRAQISSVFLTANLKTGLPVLLHVVQPLVDGLVRRRPEAAARRHAERRAAAAVDLVREVDDAAAVGRRAHDDRARAVAEQHARRAVGVVDDARHDVGADGQRVRDGCRPPPCERRSSARR